MGATLGSRRAADIVRILPDGVGPPARVPREIFFAAHRCYVSGQRLDMQALARQLKVGRATLYRRAGNREELLDEVIWWHARRALAASARDAGRLVGAARICAVVAGLLRRVEADSVLRAFLESDPEVALRILTGTRSRVQRGIAATFCAVVDLETERGNFATELDTSTLAYAIVRLGEGFLYADVIADRPPDVDRAITVIDALLRGLNNVRR
jgi:AcrR family transcriptional regulator